jgi:hypothetical protein
MALRALNPDPRRTLHLLHVQTLILHSEFALMPPLGLTPPLRVHLAAVCAHLPTLASILVGVKGECD